MVQIGQNRCETTARGPWTKIFLLNKLKLIKIKSKLYKIRKFLPLGPTKQEPENQATLDNFIGNFFLNNSYIIFEKAHRRQRA